MRITGWHHLPFAVEQVWSALLDPAVLVATIPGCERLEATGDHTYDMTVTAGVAAISGTYSGTCALSDLVEHESLVMRLRGAGAPGTVDATVRVGFEQQEGGTRIAWDADAVVGGMVGGVGQRMLGSVSRRMAGEFFGNVADAIGQPAGRKPLIEQVEDLPESVRPGQVFTAPLRAGGVASHDFLTGVALGAGLVLAGVVVGAIFGRRR